MSDAQRQWPDQAGRIHEGPLVAAGHGSEVIACAGCGFRHVVPLPDEVELQRFYTESFYGGFHVDYIERQRQDLPWWRLEFQAKIDLFEELLPSDRRSLLDVGSGAGWFLHYGAERGWQTLGVEPNEAAILHARDELRQEVVAGFFTADTAAACEPVDVVHLHNVLEHVADPAAVLAAAAACLTEDGMVAVTVPNDFNPLQEALVRLRGHERWWVDPREHLSYFDRGDLESLLVRQGFSPERHLASFPLELFALMGDDYLADSELGPVIHRKRMALEHAMHEAGCADLLASLYGKLGELGLGRTLTVVARLDPQSSS